LEKSEGFFLVLVLSKRKIFYIFRIQSFKKNQITSKTLLLIIIEGGLIHSKNYRNK